MNLIVQAGLAPDSPCNGVCTMDPRRGWCQGCWRTLDEIAAWASLDTAQQQRVLTDIAERKVTSGTPIKPAARPAGFPAP